MTSFTERAARHFVVIKAARELRKELETAGIDNLITLANADISIVGTYLKGCSNEEKAKRRGELRAVLQMGVTPDMVLSELIGQMPKLRPIIESKQDYKIKELANLETFLKEG